MILDDGYFGIDVPGEIQRILWPKVYTASALAALTPVKIYNWNTDNSCIAITACNDEDDNCVGITIEALDNATVYRNSVYRDGMIANVDTSGLYPGYPLYATTLGTLTTDASHSNLISQVIGMCFYSHATNGVLWLNGTTLRENFKKLIKLETIKGLDAVAASNGNGGNIILEPGEKDGSGTDGKVRIRQAGTVDAVDGDYFELWHDGVTGFLKNFTAGVASAFVYLGKFIIRKDGSVPADNDDLEIEHDGTDGILKSKSGLIKLIATRIRAILSSDGTKYVDIYPTSTDGVIEPHAGELQTNNHTINTGTGKLKGATAILSDLTKNQIVEVENNDDKNLISVAKESAYNKAFGTGTNNIPEIGAALTASKIVETDTNSKLISVAKGTAFNKDFGTGASDVCVGNDARLSDTRVPNDDSVTTDKMDDTLPGDTINIITGLQWNGTDLQEKHQSITVSKGIITAIGTESSYANVGAV